MAAPTHAPLSNASNKFPLAIQRLPHRATPCRDVVTPPAPLSRLNTTPSFPQFSPSSLLNSMNLTLKSNGFGGEDGLDWGGIALELGGKSREECHKVLARFWAKGVA